MCVWGKRWLDTVFSYRTGLNGMAAGLMHGQLATLEWEGLRVPPPAGVLCREHPAHCLEMDMPPADVSSPSSRIKVQQVPDPSGSPRYRG